MIFLSIIFIFQNDDIDFHHKEDFTLNLSNNKITSFVLDNVNSHFGTTKHQSIIILELQNNPLKCDCHLENFLEFMELKIVKLKERLVVHTGSIRCFNPQKYENNLLSDLKYRNYQYIPTASELNNFTLCPLGCGISYKISTKDFIIDCSNRNLSNAPDTLCYPQRDFVSFKLNLTGNFIKDFPKLNQTGYNLITDMLLSHNQIKTIPEDVLLYKLHVS